MKVFYGEVYRDSQLVATTAYYSKIRSAKRAVNNLKSIYQEQEEILETQIQKFKKAKK